MSINAAVLGYLYFDFSNSVCFLFCFYASALVHSFPYTYSWPFLMCFTPVGILINWPKPNQTITDSYDIFTIDFNLSCNTRAKLSIQELYTYYGIQVTSPVARLVVHSSTRWRWLALIKTILYIDISQENDVALNDDCVFVNRPCPNT